jgi:hypothetical protein
MGGHSVKLRRNGENEFSDAKVPQVLRIFPEISWGYGRGREKAKSAKILA